MKLQYTAPCPLEATKSHPKKPVSLPSPAFRKLSGRRTSYDKTATTMKCVCTCITHISHWVFECVIQRSCNDQNTQDINQGKIYSKTSDNRPFEKWTTSRQQTDHLPLNDFTIELAHSFSNLREADTSQLQTTDTVCIP